MTCFLDIFDFLARYLFQSMSHYFPLVLSNWSRVRKLIYPSHSITFSRNINLELDVLTLYWKRWYIDSLDLGGPIFLLLFRKELVWRWKKQQTSSEKQHETQRDVVAYFQLFLSCSYTSVLEALLHCIKRFSLLLKPFQVGFLLLSIQKFLAITAEKIWLFKPQLPALLKYFTQFLFLIEFKHLEV